jgi:hypothetical protein
MPIEFTCPGCQNLLRVPDEHAGKQARCPECQQLSQIPLLVMDDQPVAAEPPVVPRPTENPFATSAAPATGAMPYQPHRGTQLMIWGIVSLCCCSVLGFVPLLMANADLAAMDRGEMDPSGRGITQAARVLGIVALVILALSAGANAINLGLQF